MDGWIVPLRTVIVTPPPCSYSWVTGDNMLGISGRPYDTLEEVIGLRGPRHPRNTEGSDRLRQLSGSLREWGIGYDQVKG